MALFIVKIALLFSTLKKSACKVNVFCPDRKLFLTFMSSWL